MDGAAYHDDAVVSLRVTSDDRCRTDKTAIWRAGNEKTGAKYVALFNLSEEESEMTVSRAEAEMEAGACLTELWTGERATVAQGVLHANIPAHGCAVYETGLL